MQEEGYNKIIHTFLGQMLFEELSFLIKNRS